MSFSANGRQVFSLMLLFLTGWTLTARCSGRDDWLAVILASAAGLILLSIFCLPQEHLENSIFSIINLCFGDILGQIFTVLLCLYAFWSLCMTILSAIIFLRTVSENMWPIWLIASAIILVSGFAASGGVTRMALWSEPIIWIVLLSLVLSLILTMPEADFANIRPILSDGWDGISAQTFDVLSVPFAESWFAAAILSGKSRQLRQSGLIAMIYAGILLSLTAMRNIAVLGQAGALSVWYPTFTAAGLIELGQSFQRGEVLVSGSLLLCEAVRAAVFLCFIADGFDENIPKSSRKASIWILGAACVIVCTAFAGSTADFQKIQMLYRKATLPAIVIFSSLTAALAVKKSKKVL